MRRLTVAAIAFPILILWTGILSADYWIVYNVRTGEADFNSLGALRLGIDDFDTLDALRYVTGALYAALFGYVIWAFWTNRKERRIAMRRNS